MNYYNDNDEFACEWLRELIKDRLIPEGEVDDRDIRTIEPRELEGFTQCHFFAGVGGWPLALRLSGWPEDREVWTGSCPCQPFSIAGKGGGVEDERLFSSPWRPWKRWKWVPPAHAYDANIPEDRVVIRPHWMNKWLENQKKG